MLKTNTLLPLGGLAENPQAWRKEKLSEKTESLAEDRGMTVYIYALSDPRSGEVRYVGKTVNLLARYYCHTCGGPNSYKKTWIASLRKSGIGPKLEILETITNSNDEDWQESERFWITYLRFLGFNLCNLDTGGRGGKRLSEDHKRRISEGNKGKKRSLEMRMHLSSIKKGKAPSPKLLASILKNAKARTGVKRSKEFSAIMSLALKGRKKSEEHIALIIQRNKSDRMRKLASEANRGKPKTEEHKAKLRQSMLRWHHGL